MTRRPPLIIPTLLLLVAATSGVPQRPVTPAEVVAHVPALPVASAGALRGAPRVPVQTLPVANLGSSEGLTPGAMPAPSRKWTATYCKPTPRYCRGWGGDAHLAAVRSFRWGHEPYWVRVEHVAGGQVHTTTALVVSYCECPRTKGRDNIDLSVAAYRELDPTLHGRIRVTVTRIDGVPTKLPETATENQP